MSATLLDNDDESLADVLEGYAYDLRKLNRVLAYSLPVVDGVSEEHEIEPERRRDTVPSVRAG